jgi:uncharacterized membrane protein
MTYLIIYLLIGVFYSFINYPIIKNQANKTIDENIRDKSVLVSLVILVLVWPVVIISNIFL